MKQSINLLPKKSPQEEGAKQQKQKTYARIAGGFFLLLLFLLSPFVFLQNVKEKERKLTSQITEKEKTLAMLSESEQLYRIVYNRASAARVLLQNKKKFLQEIQNLQRFVTPGVAIKSFAVSQDGAIKLTITAPDISTTRDLLDHLELIARDKSLVKNLAISSISTDRAVGYEVKIEGELIL